MDAFTGLTAFSFIVTMVALPVYIGACALVANVAGMRGLRSSGWFFAALICTPLMAILGVIATPAFLDFPQRQFGRIDGPDRTGR